MFHRTIFIILVTLVSTNLIWGYAINPASLASVLKAAGNDCVPFLVRHLSKNKDVYHLDMIQISRLNHHVAGSVDNFLSVLSQRKQQEQLLVDITFKKKFENDRRRFDFSKVLNQKRFDHDDVNLLMKTFHLDIDVDPADEIQIVIRYAFSEKSKKALRSMLGQKEIIETNRDMIEAYAKIYNTFKKQAAQGTVEGAKHNYYEVERAFIDQAMQVHNFQRKQFDFNTDFFKIYHELGSDSNIKKIIQSSPNFEPGKTLW